MILMIFASNYHFFSLKQCNTDKFVKKTKKATPLKTMQYYMLSNSKQMHFSAKIMENLSN